MATKRKKRHSYIIVHGQSPNTSDEAVAEAQLQVDSLAKKGWEAISVGMSARAMVYTEDIDNVDVPHPTQHIDVLVLMRK